MNKEELARFLINAEENQIGGIPISLIVDDNEVNVDLEKMVNFIVVGKNSKQTINEIVSQINKQYIFVVNNLNDFTILRKDFMNRLATHNLYYPPQVVIIPDISIFCGMKKMKSMLREIFNKGKSLRSYCICACTTNTDADNYYVAIPVKMYEEEYVGEKDIDSLWTFTGTVRKIVR